MVRGSLSGRCGMWTGCLSRSSCERLSCFGCWGAAPQQPKQDNLSQEDLLKQPVHIPHRPLKDPRTILMLDPACGSMHFGLYAFDLFEVIYEEAWDLEEVGTAVFSRPPGMQSLHETYPDKQAFL